MNVKLGKEKIQNLITDALDKYEGDTGQRNNRNQTVTNYSGLANTLSEIANNLPGIDSKKFPPDYGGNYTVTNAQVRDAFFGKVDSLKEHFYEACNLYLYGKFSKELDTSPGTSVPPVIAPLPKPIQQPNFKKLFSVFLLASLVMFAAMVFLLYKWFEFRRLKEDLTFMPYQPTEAEIASLEGVWKIYTGSPQARTSDPNRYHMVVPNIVEVVYKNGYFTFNRYGPTLDQTGYMQFEFQDLVSIHTVLRNSLNKIIAVKHSLLYLDKGISKLNVISASWNYDSSSRIIGIREIYEKLGSAGKVEVSDDPLAKNSCNCRPVIWHRGANKGDTTFYLKNQFLDTLQDQQLKKLIDHESILLRRLEDGLILKEPMQQADTAELKRSVP